MDKKLFTIAADVIKAVVETDSRRAVKYVAPNMVVRATRTLFGRKINRRGNIELKVTIGKPNARERDFIKDCKKAGEPFPVKGVMVQPLPDPKKSAAAKKGHAKKNS